MKLDLEEYNEMVFFNTTGEDERDCFFGAASDDSSQFLITKRTLPDGNYRVIDGQLCRIISGLPTEEVRKRLNSGAVKSKPNAIIGQSIIDTITDFEAECEYMIRSVNVNRIGTPDGVSTWDVSVTFVNPDDPAGTTILQLANNKEVILTHDKMQSHAKCN